MACDYKWFKTANFITVFLSWPGRQEMFFRMGLISFYCSELWATLANADRRTSRNCQRIHVYRIITEAWVLYFFNSGVELAIAWGHRLFQIQFSTLCCINTLEKKTQPKTFCSQARESKQAITMERITTLHCSRCCRFAQACVGSHGNTVPL